MDFRFRRVFPLFFVFQFAFALIPFGFENRLPVAAFVFVFVLLFFLISKEKSYKKLRFEDDGKEGDGNMSALAHLFAYVFFIAACTIGWGLLYDSCSHIVLNVSLLVANMIYIVAVFFLFIKKLDFSSNEKTE